MRRRRNTARICHTTHTSDEGIDAQPVHEIVVPFLRGGEELGHKVKVRVDLASSVQQPLCHFDGSVVAIVDTEPIEQPGHELCVALHVIP